MNEELDRYARDYLKINIKKLKDEYILIFKRMYSPKNLEAPIDDVIDKMPQDRLDWGMMQVKRSLINEGIEIWNYQTIFIKV